MSRYKKQDLEKAIIFRIVTYSVLAVFAYLLLNTADVIINKKEFLFTETLYLLILIGIYSMYYVLGNRDINFNYLKNTYYILFSIIVIGSFFINNGFRGPTIVDLVTVIAVGVFLYSSKTRSYIIGVFTIVIALLLWVELQSPEYIQNNITFNETFSFVFGFAVRLAMAIIVFSAVMDSYTKEREIILSKNDKIFSQNEQISQLNEELSQINYQLSNINNELNNKNINLQDTLNKLKETQLRLIQSEKMASLGVLTAGVAHEVNNPLNFIMLGYTGIKEYIKENNIPKDDDLKLLLKNIQTGLDRATIIVKSLSQFSRMSESYSEQINIHVVIDDCLTILLNQIKGRITVKRNFDQKIGNILGNSGKLHQVIINILNNAVQSIEGLGKISIETKILDSWVEVKIVDTGKGIPKKNLSKIMDPFFTTKEPGKGTGLGLSIAYTIIKEHKGSIDIISQENKGTTVILQLPLKN